MLEWVLIYWLCVLQISVLLFDRRIEKLEKLAREERE